MASGELPPPVQQSVEDGEALLKEYQQAQTAFRKRALQVMRRLQPFLEEYEASSDDLTNIPPNVDRTYALSESLHGIFLPTLEELEQQ